MKVLVMPTPHTRTGSSGKVSTVRMPRTVDKHVLPVLYESLNETYCTDTYAL